MLQCMSLEVARRGPPEISAASPLSGEKRTSNAQNEPFRLMLWTAPRHTPERDPALAYKHPAGPRLVGSLRS